MPNGLGLVATLRPAIDLLTGLKQLCFMSFGTEIIVSTTILCMVVGILLPLKILMATVFVIGSLGIHLGIQVVMRR